MEQVEPPVLKRNPVLGSLLIFLVIKPRAPVLDLEGAQGCFAPLFACGCDHFFDNLVSVHNADQLLRNVYFNPEV